MLLMLLFVAGFEKMDSGLKENFPDRVSPIKIHVDSLKSLGAETGPLNPYINAVTSNVVRVYMCVCVRVCMCVCVSVCMCVCVSIYKSFNYGRISVCLELLFTRVGEMELVLEQHRIVIH